MKKVFANISMFSLALLFCCAVSCRKQDTQAPADPPKTTTELMKQMVGKYRMVGYTSSYDPGGDTTIEFDEYWDVFFVNDRYMFIKYRNNVEFLFNFQSNLPANNAILFVREYSGDEGELRYYYLKDSLHYYYHHSSSGHSTYSAEFNSVSKVH